MRGSAHGWGSFLHPAEDIRAARRHPIAPGTLPPATARAVDATATACCRVPAHVAQPLRRSGGNDKSFHPSRERELHEHDRSYETGSANAPDRCVPVNTTVALAALALGAISLTLFVVSLRRLLNRQSEVVVTMLQRYDDRLATFAQSLNDALTSLPAHDAPSLSLGDDAEPVMRTLELAVAGTAADGAVALVTGSSGAPVVATIGLSEAETHHIARMGFPDYRGARAIEVAFSGDIDAPDGSPAIRAGLVLPLLGEDVPHSLLSVLTRESKRRFSEDDVTTLTEIVARTRPAITRALNLREPDVVPELDLLTSLYDRRSFEAILEREISRARAAHRPLFLLLVDVERLTTLNAQIGRLAADGALLVVAERLRAHVDRLDYTFRLVGGRFGVVRLGGTADDANELFASLQRLFDSEPVGEAGFISLSAGSWRCCHMTTRHLSQSVRTPPWRTPNAPGAVRSPTATESPPRVRSRSRDARARHRDGCRRDRGPLSQGLRDRPSTWPDRDARADRSSRRRAHASCHGGAGERHPSPHRRVARAGTRPRRGPRALRRGCAVAPPGERRRRHVEVDGSHRSAAAGLDPTATDPGTGPPDGAGRPRDRVLLSLLRRGAGRTRVYDPRSPCRSSSVGDRSAS